jgi:hypothetical protein|tara:strand:- start:4962 stop:5177 length:216 start_codon:yes stop_codon:yes gene_type:complete
MNKTVEQTTARFQALRDINPVMYYSSINDIREMADGRDPDGIRLAHYQGCDDEFFEEVLCALGEKSSNDMV